MTAEKIWWLIASIAPGPIWWLWRWYRVRRMMREAAALRERLNRPRQFRGAIRLPGKDDARLIEEDES